MHDLHPEALEEEGTLLMGLRVGVDHQKSFRLFPGRKVVPDRHVGFSRDEDAELYEPLERLPHTPGL